MQRQQLIRLRAPRTKALQVESWNLLGRNMEKAAGWTLEVPSLLRQQPSVLLRLRRPSQAPQHFSIQEQATPLNNATHHRHRHRQRPEQQPARQFSLSRPLLAETTPETCTVHNHVVRVYYIGPHPGGCPDCCQGAADAPLCRSARPADSLRGKIPWPLALGPAYMCASDEEKIPKAQHS